MDYKNKKILIAILIGSFLIRLIGINQSMWLDEAISANVARMPVMNIVSDFSVADFHPPLYYIFLHFWVKILGSSVIAMRISSVLFSLMTIWLVYKIGERIKDEKTGLWAALWLGVNPLLIYFSQELRMYSMVTMSLTGAVYFWIKVLKKESWKNILGFNILIFFSFLTFYGSIFLIGTMLLYFLIKKKYKIFLLGSLGIIGAIMIVSPLLMVQLKNSANMLNQVTNWGLVLGKVNLKNLLLIPIKFSVGRIDWYPKIFYYGVSGVWTLMVFGQVCKGIIKNKKLGFLFITPIILAIIFSFKSPMLQYFRFLYLLPIMAMLLAISVKNKLVKIILMIGFWVMSGIYLLNSKMHRENWKDLAKDLTSEVYMIESFSDPIKFYQPEIKIYDLKDKIEGSKIEVIPYGEAIHGIDHEKILTENGYKIMRKENYREMILEKWGR